MMTDTRPDPDALLEKVQRAEAIRRRGSLKIFFGASAGVGKTFGMLLAAHERRAEGLDVVAGYVETHKRVETEQLLQGLEILPMRLVDYQNTQLREFDLDAALRRHPALILVDVLAHTNAPGSRHPKRWQDVEELLDAGIDVYSTINVQHIESLNDVVSQITGIPVWETVPDAVLESANEIELIDLPPDELLLRLKEGKVYLPQQQLVRGQVDQLDFIRALQHRVGHGLPYRDAGDLRDYIVEAFDVLDVDRGIDIDT